MNPELTRVAAYYTQKLSLHGPTPAGVDWNGAESQHLRFETLLKVVPDRAPAVSIDDYGCGYGALLDHLRSSDRSDWDYQGYDISKEMIDAAWQRFPAEKRRFKVGHESSRQAEFAVASGIFNVRLDTPAEAWEKQILDTLDRLHATSTTGFAFNCLTTYSDPPRRRDYLFYGDPCHYFDLCKRRYSRDVALLHDYGLYEFTLLVRKKGPS